MLAIESSDTMRIRMESLAESTEPILSGHGAEQRSMERNYQSPARFRHAAAVVLPPRSISPDPSDLSSEYLHHLRPSLFHPHSHFSVSVPLRSARVHVRASMRCRSRTFTRCAFIRKVKTDNMANLFTWRTRMAKASQSVLKALYILFDYYFLTSKMSLKNLFFRLSKLSYGKSQKIYYKLNYKLSP